MHNVEFLCEPQNTSVDYSVTTSEPEMIGI